jgi:osmotically-inducible protein OsmY
MMIKSKTFRVLALTAVALVLTTACASTRTQKTLGQEVDDVVITAGIKSELIADPLTKAHDIDVEVFKGRVQLNGYVGSDQERIQAVALARKVNGVKVVENNLKLKGASQTTGDVIDDAALTASVKMALANDERTKAYQISIETRESVVMLAGFVNNPAARLAAVDVARGVKGVARVDNQITIK